MKVNIGILRIIIARALPVPVLNRALKRKIIKKLRKECSIFRESFFQSQNVTEIKKSLSLFLQIWKVWRNWKL